MRNFFLAAFAAAIVSLPVNAAPPVANTAQIVDDRAKFEQSLKEIFSRAPKQIGIAVVSPRLPNYPTTFVSHTWIYGEESFPLASVMKLAVAAKWLADVDAGKRRLDTMIVVPERLRLGSDGIGQMMPHPGVTLSAANLIELMITVSDNTATDVLVERLGGPAAIQRWLVAEGFEDFRIDRPIANLLLDTVGLPVMAGKSPAQTMWASEAPEDVSAARARFMADPRDTATPGGVAEFLYRIDSGKLLKPASRAFLLGVMGRTRTGNDRLKAGLPEGTKLEHKTGTLSLVSNDAGIITLPNGKRIIVVVMVAGPADAKFRAQVIADVAKVVWEQLPR